MGTFVAPHVLGKLHTSAIGDKQMTFVFMARARNTNHSALPSASLQEHHQTPEYALRLIQRH